MCSRDPHFSHFNTVSTDSCFDGRQVPRAKVRAKWDG
ncbi:uncharacterized protein CCOS01_02867 [Colletotrichum costaricense]|uniref:Uncharacterized protein n=1 Tax=Colletotrichum costaricense TaxID=1209916 RepID=A0AAI9Z416_9PEZI|nr:uncharacterized protein CCOS01_02867 [Colletotrichum costaricense]KAK1534115.1 hypothetical protein CCOS01_02867 [Colletotrichum costaricense]